MFDLIDFYDDDIFVNLMIEFGGYCLVMLFEVFEQVSVLEMLKFIIVYIIKGCWLLFQGYKDNYFGLMMLIQIGELCDCFGIFEGEEWVLFVGLFEVCMDKVKVVLVQVLWCDVKKER